MNQEVWLSESGWWGRLPTLSSPACFGGAKKGKYQKWGDDRHMEVGQDKELSPKLLSQGEVTHNTVLNTVRRTQRHGRKESENEVHSGRIKKEWPVHSFFRPIDTSAES